MAYPYLAYGTPRKLPNPRMLVGRVVVLDVAFAANAGGASFEKVTLPFLEGLGERLAMWVDHHDHEKQKDYKDDPRFVLHTKAEHGACPEIITPEMVARAGVVDTICCHVDFDGLCSAAKWICGGVEPYPGADQDAYAIDTRLGQASERGVVLDRALRAHPRDDQLKHNMVRYLAGGGQDLALFEQFIDVSADLRAKEEVAAVLSQRYQIKGNVAVCDATKRPGFYDKTTLLLLGQEQALISLVHDESTVTVAARFDSGVDLVKALGLNGGMPTRVSVSAKKLNKVLKALEKL